MRGEPALVADGGDARVERHRARRHVGAEHGQRAQRRDLAAQLRHLRGRGPPADAPGGDERRHRGDVGQAGQLVGAVLDGERHHDRADPDDGEERGHDLDRVGQLDADRVPGGDALVEQHLGEPGHLVVDLRPGERAGRAVGQRVPVQRVDDRGDVTELGDARAEQRVDRVVGPVALLPVLPDALGRMKSHPFPPLVAVAVVHDVVGDTSGCAAAWQGSSVPYSHASGRGPMSCAQSKRSLRLAMAHRPSWRTRSSTIRVATSASLTTPAALTLVRAST